MLIIPDTVDVSIDIRAMTAAGAALTGKVAADFTMWYRRDAAKVAIVLSDLALLTTAHTDGGIKEIGDGWYRLDLPDAACATGANRVAIGGTVDGGVVVSAPVTIDNLLTTALAESYAAVDTAATPAQLLYMILSRLQANLDGTELTCYELDGSTTAMTFTVTLNTAGYPVKVVRAT